MRGSDKMLAVEKMLMQCESQRPCGESARESGGWISESFLVPFILLIKDFLKPLL